MSEAPWLRRSGLALALLASSLCSVTEARADAWQTFKQAREIVDAGGDYARAEQLLRQAIEEEGESYNKLIKRYIPHYYLGRVLAQKGDCRGALAEFQLSVRYGAIKADQVADLRTRESRCEKVVSDVSAARTRAESEVARAGEAAKKVEQVARQPILSPLWSEGSPSFEERQGRAVQRLGGFANRLRRADRDLDSNALAAVEREAKEVAEQLDTLAADANARLAEVDAAMGEASARVTESVSTARRLLRSVRDLDPLPEQLAGAVSALRRALTQVDRQSGTADVDTLKRLADEVEGTTRRLRPLAAGPPKSLRTAAEAYLSNDLQAVLDTLAEESYSDPRSLYHSLLLRAAAVYGLWIAEGQSSEARKVQLDELLSQAVALDPPPGRPGPDFYPPGFRALYAGASAAAEEGADEGDSADESS